MPRLLIITEYQEPFINETIKGIKRYVLERNVPDCSICTLSDEYRNKIGMEGLLEWCKAWNVDFVMGSFKKEDKIDLLTKEGIMVITNNIEEEIEGIPNIRADARANGRFAARFFMDKKYTNFGLYTHTSDKTGQNRFKGFIEELRKAGLEDRCSVHLFDEDNDFHEELSGMREWLSGLPKPVAILAGKDHYGNNLIELCNVFGIGVPTEVAVLGSGNDERVCNMKITSLSSFSMDVEDVGWKIGEMLHRCIMQPNYKGYDIIMKPATVTERVSTASVASTDPDIQKVARFIKDNIRSKITVSDVMNEVAVSRRLLEKKFKAFMGKGIYEYILESKIKLFTEIVMNTSEPIQNIAMTFGDNDAKNLSRKFKEIHGCSPAQWRARNRIESMPFDTV